MGYGKEIYVKATAELHKRRAMAESAARQRLDQFHRICPRAREIEQEKARQGAQAAIAVLRGKDAKSHLERLKRNNLSLQEEYAQLCRQHGLSVDALSPAYTCQACKDSGFVDGRMCACLRALQKELAFQTLQLAVPLDQSSFETFSLDYYSGKEYEQMQRIYAFCNRYAERFTAQSKSILFRGATGLGKTHLALAIASVAIDKGYGVIYGSSHLFATAFEKERFEKTDDNQITDTVGKLINCDLLIIDDLGTEFTSSFVNAMLYHVINTRLLSEKPTIISTNLTNAELEKRYSERFASRINGHYNTFVFLGRDIRIQRRMRGTPINQS